VIVTFVNDLSAKSHLATPAVIEVALLTNFPPPEVYCPEFGTWFPVVKEVVAEFRVAEEV
jgi:hypothetical protein